MLLVGLTGGIGSGKSTVAKMLADRGAAVLDADALAREAVAPGTPGLAQIVEAFGAGVLGSDGRLDRQELARLVFADADLRAKLESITHPEIGRLFGERIEAYRDSDRVVVYDAALLVERGIQAAFDVLVVVTAPDEDRVRRLVEGGMQEADVRARLASQLPQEAKAEVADVVIENGGTIEDLERQVDRLWQELARRASERP